MIIFFPIIIFSPYHMILIMQYSVVFLFKVFEDTEFHQMEAEAHREAEREELNKEVSLRQGRC